MIRFEPGKYRQTVWLVALFLLINAVVLGASLWVADRFRVDSQTVELVARQSTLIERMTRALLQLEARATQGLSTADLVRELEEVPPLFERTLDALARGGEVVGSDGRPVSLRPVQSERARHALADAQALWVPWRETIGLALSRLSIDRDAAIRAARMAEERAPKLAETMRDLTTSTRAAVASDIVFLRVVQMLGLLMVAANFVFIILHIMRTLRAQDAEIELARKETEDILRTTQEGLFLLDHDMHIGTQFSRSLMDILGSKRLAGCNFLDLLRPMVSQKTFDAAREYIALQFRGDMSEKMITALNPLDCVEVSVVSAPGEIDTRYLSFAFIRVKREGQITHLLVTAADITRRVQLERDLRDTQNRSQGQMALLLDVLRVEPVAMREFLDTLSAGLSKINEVLETQPGGAETLHGKIAPIYRETHRLKGDAGALGLQSIAGLLNEAEEAVNALNLRKRLTGEDFLPLAVRIKALFGELAAAEQLVAHLGKLNPLVTVEPARPPLADDAAEQVQVRQWVQFATQLAQRHGKQVQIAYQGLDIGKLPASLREVVVSVVNQFIRNAVVHGVETPQERRTSGKAEAGRLALYVADMGAAGIEISFRDDGRGIDTEAIRAAAVRVGLLSAESARSIESRNLVPLIFEPGITTAVKPEADAGHGAGLDSVRDLIRRHRGQIRVGTTFGEYCHFRVSLPPVAVQRGEAPPPMQAAA